MEKRLEVRESVDFVDVVNHALIDVYDARARISWTPWKPDLKSQVFRYYSAVSSLYNLVAPVLGLGLDSELGRAEKLLRANSFREGVEVLDSIVRKLVASLRDAGLLFRAEVVKVGGVRVAALKHDKEGVKE